MAQKLDFLSLPVREFAAATAARTPTPGGGSVAAVVAALGAALGEMSLNFTRGKKKFAEHEAYYEHLAMRLGRTRQMMLDLVADDVSAYELYQDSTKLPDGVEKIQAVQLALAAAIDVPRELAKVSLSLLADLAELLPKCSKMLVSDLAAAAALAAAAVKLSDYNVRVNVPHLAETQAAAELHESSAADVRRALELLAAIEDQVKKDLP